jgi:hypothetical protein
VLDLDEALASSTRMASYTRVRGTSLTSLMSFAVPFGIRVSATKHLASYSLSELL